eukprot:gene7544-15453_t
MNFLRVAKGRLYRKAVNQVQLRLFGAAHGNNTHAHAHNDGHGQHDSHGDHGHHDSHGGHGHHEPHIPVLHDMVGKGMLITCFLWIFYRFKENNGKIFGFNLPWLEEHEHEHFHFVHEDAGSMPTLSEDDEDEHEEHDHDDHDDE